jgi:hypothetical protein
VLAAFAGTTYRPRLDGTTGGTTGTTGDTGNDDSGETAAGKPAP